jgi:hypothetical protein
LKRFVNNSPAKAGGLEEATKVAEEQSQSTLNSVSSSVIYGFHVNIDQTPKSSFYKRYFK